jgi:hypothetical protein
MYQGEKVRVIVKSSKNSRITFDTFSKKVSQDGFLVPTMELSFIDPVPGMVEAVKSYASAHYDEGGWDIVVEAYEDSEIAELVKKCTSNEQAIRKVRSTVSVQADYRDDIRATAY